MPVSIFLKVLKERASFKRVEFSKNCNLKKTHSILYGTKVKNIGPFKNYMGFGIPFIAYCKT